MPTHDHGTRLSTKGKAFVSNESAETSAQVNTKTTAVEIEKQKRQVTPSPSKETTKRRLVAKSARAACVPKQKARTTTRVSACFALYIYSIHNVR
jgi:hypothetical protein